MLQVVAVMLESDVPLSVQPPLIRLKFTLPLPDPPEVVRVILLPFCVVVIALEIVSIAWGTAENAKVTGALVTAAKTPWAAFVAVTVQDVGVVALRVAPKSLQPADGGSTNFTAPAPDPPVVVSGMGVPALALVGELEMERGCCGARVKMNLTTAEMANL